MGKNLKEIIRGVSYLILLTPLIGPYFFPFSNFFFFPFVSPKSLYFFALSELIFFSFLILILFSPNFLPKKNLILISLIFYLFVFSLSTIFGVNPLYSFWSKHERMTGLLMQLHLFGFFLALSSIFEKESFKNFFVFSILISIFGAIFGILNVENPVMRGGGTLGNESFLGTYLLFNIFFSLYLYFSSFDWKKKFGLISFLILTICLLLVGIHFKGNFLNFLVLAFYKEGARAAKISLYGGLILLFLLWLIFQKKRIFKILGLSILIPSILIFVFGLYSLMFEPQSFFRHLVEKEVGSFGGRFFVWEIAKKGFFERPFFGFGPENFEFLFQKNFNPCFGTEICGEDVWYDRAHNLIFDTLSTLGIFGLISIFSIYFFAIFVLWKNFLKKKINFFEAAVFNSLFASYFVQNLTVFDMVSSYLMLFLTLSFLASLEKEKTNFEIKKPSKILILIFSILFLFCFLNFVIFPAISSKAVISTLNSPPFSKERMNFYKKAIFSPLGRFQIRQFLAQNLISDFEKNPVSGERVKAELDFFEEEMKKNLKECNLDFRSYLILGNLLNLQAQINPEKIKEAENVLKKAIEISPKNQRGYWALAQTEILKGNFENAIFLAQKALDLEKNLKQSHLVLIKILKLAKKEDLAREKIKEAIEINPHWEKELDKIF